jgi:hypothetical protein
MTLPNGEQTLEVRDATGSLLGFIVPEKDFRDLVSERDVLRKELAALKANVEQLRRDRAEIEELKKQLAEARSDLDNFEKMLHAWDAHGVAPPGQADIEEARHSGIRGRQLLAEIEQLLFAPPGEDRP